MGSSISTAKDVQYSVVVPGSEATAERTAVRRHYSCMDRVADNFSTNPIKNAWELFQMGVSRSADSPCLGTREKLSSGRRGEYVWKTYREVERLALEAGSGLINGDLARQRTFDSGTSNSLSVRCIGIFAKNREEWVITEHACNAYGITLVPLYDTLGSQSTQFILKETQMETVVSDGDCLVKIMDALQEYHAADGEENGKEALSIKCIITLDDVPESENKKAEAIGLQLIPWERLLEMGRASMVPLTDDVQPTLESLHTICYTSGTTGSPKGVMMTHGNFVAAVATSLEGPHVYERICENLVFSCGGRVGFYSGCVFTFGCDNGRAQDTQKLLDDVQTLKPTVFCSVPRLFQRIEERVTSSLQGKSVLAKSLFNQALAAKIRRLRSTGDPHYPLWDKIVFDKFRNLMGGRVRLMLTGSAPLDPQILERMRAFFCCWIVEGYGMTETIGASFLTWNVYDRNPGQVGGVLPSLEFCLLDISESMAKYSIKDPIPKGELCLRGATRFTGYFRNPTETAAAIDQEGWLHTGDIAALLGNGGIQIIDRKKNIFKLAQGEYVAPEKIESVYTQSQFVAQCFVFGFSSENALVAIVVPDYEQTLRWLRETRGQSVDDSQALGKLIRDPELQQAIFEDMQQVGKKHGLKGFELVRKIHLHADQFTVESGLLTPTFKLKRHYAKEVFSEQIDKMYAMIHAEYHHA